MQRSCPNPDCQEGLVVVSRGLSLRRGRTRTCSSCAGKGEVDEHHQDLRNAGIVTWGTTEEDFRSFPTLWR